MQDHTFLELVALAEAHPRRALSTRLVDLGFDRTHPQKDFCFEIFHDEAMENGIVYFIDKAGMNCVRINDTVLGERIRYLLFRMIAFSAGYGNGVKKILERTPTFALCLEDGYPTFTSTPVTDRPVFAFAREAGDVETGLVPDPYGLWDAWQEPRHNHLLTREEAETDFRARKQILFWRGTLTGLRKGDSVDENIRVKFCREAKKHPELCDAKFTGFIQHARFDGTPEILESEGLMAPWANEEDFAQYTSYIDLEGFTAAWGTIRKYLRCIQIIKPPARFEHYFDFFQDENCATRVTNPFDGETSFADFNVAYNGYLAAHRALELIRSGDATVFPIIRR